MKRRLFNFPWRTARDIRADVDDELRFHIEERTSALTASGLAPDAARAQALREFGDVDDTRRYINNFDRGTESMNRRKDYFGELRQDLTYAIRKLRSSPAFTITAIVTLALGIGANAAIFSVVNGVLLRPLPFPHAEQLLKVYSANRSAASFHAPVSPLDLDDWRAQRSGLVDIGGYFYSDGGSGVDLTGDGEPQRLNATFVTPGFFSTLEVGAAEGRLPREDELVRGGPDKVAVLSYGFWQRQYGSSRSVVGTHITLEGAPYQVIGVMPRSFAYPSDRVDVYVPYSTITDNMIPRIRPVRILEAVARMRPGMTVTAANAELNTIARRLAVQYPEDAAWGETTVAPLKDDMTGSVRTALLVLLGAVAFVLVMGCVNVASLLLARASVREREFAVRAALGAGRGRILRQLLTESVVLALAGGIAGLVVARVGVGALLSLSAGQLPRGSDVHLDMSVLLFALALSLVTGLLFGLVPALHASRGTLQGTLREAGRGVAGGARRLRSALVIVEVALAVVLVVGAGLMSRSFVQLMKVDPGFRPDHLITVNFHISAVRRPNDWQQYYRAVIDKARTVPGVISVGATKDAPFRGNGERDGFTPPGYVAKAGEDSPTARMMHISDGYFQTIGAHILNGREFSQNDRADGPHLILVNEAFAKRWFPGENAVGKSIGMGPTQINGQGAQAQIIGVVADIRQAAMAEPALETIYENNMVNGRVKVALVARTAGEPLAMARKLREAIWSVDKEQAIMSIETFDDVVSGSMARPRLLTVLLGSFGALGLILGALGIYGVLAYLVNERTREIGVRIALGAPASSVLWMFVGRGLALTIAGLGLGLGSALMLTRLMSGVLYGVTATDPLTFVTVGAVLLGVAALASWLPARRAARLDPVAALRSD
jgi:putative ABC transport system permease protein